MTGVVLLLIIRPSLPSRFFFFFNDTATTEIYTLSLHDALPISHGNPIPGMAKPRRVEPFPLAQAMEGATVVVERITEEAEADKRLLEYLWRNDIRRGRRLKIVEVAPWAGTITAACDGQTIALGLPAAAKIWVYAPNESSRGGGG